jgi:hypothetical protein
VGAVAGAAVGGIAGGWFGSLADDTFGVSALLYGAFGAWAGAAGSIWAVLSLAALPVPSPTALMFTIVSVPAAILFGVGGAWFGPELPDISGLWFVLAWLTTSCFLARFVAVGNEAKDPFGEPPGS